MDEKKTPKSDGKMEIKEVIDERRKSLATKFEAQSGQGILPATDMRYFEQSNPIVRSSLFSMSKARGELRDWTEVFSFGSGSISYRGPSMTIEHEQVLAKIMWLARGRSLTKAVSCNLADVRKWLQLSDTGPNFKKARMVLDDLAGAELRISCKHALKRLYVLLTSPAISNRPDGKFFKDYIDNRYGAQLKMIASAINNDTNVDISMRFIMSQAQDTHSGRLLISIDPIMAVFFDGVNTTMVPFEVMEDVDRFGKKILPFIASHRDGVYAMTLESYHKFSGSKADFATGKRRFKYEFKRRCEIWESKGYIEPGWEFYRNKQGIEMVSGLKIGHSVRLKSNLTSFLTDGEISVPAISIQDVFEQTEKSQGELV